MIDKDVRIALRDKLVHALEMAQISMLTLETEPLRPLLLKAKIIDRIKPEKSSDGIAGADEMPFSLFIPADSGQSFNLDLSTQWITDTPPEAMISYIVEAIRGWNEAPHLR